MKKNHKSEQWLLFIAKWDIFFFFFYIFFLTYLRLLAISWWNQVSFWWHYPDLSQSLFALTSECFMLIPNRIDMCVTDFMSKIKKEKW